MELEDKLNKVGIIGAAGKMGRGIASIVSLMMVCKALENNSLSQCELVLHDIVRDNLKDAKKYLRKQSLRFAEKNIARLRALYESREDLIENGQIVEAFCQDVEDCCWMTTSMSDLKDCEMVFEAAVEKANLKSAILKELTNLCSENMIVMTNTSSIPIAWLEEQCSLKGRIVGFHFYNPPPVQKLVELIFSDNSSDELKSLSESLGKALGKTMVPSRDMAGFIGNGQFIREGLFALTQLKTMAAKTSPSEALIYLDHLTANYLVRPMGIFQLIDYVGIDVFSMIVDVMNEHTAGETLEDEMLSELLEKGVRGGQTAMGTQNAGFFKYDKGKKVEAYNWLTGAYEKIDEASALKKMGGAPDSQPTWKALNRSRDKESVMKQYYADLGSSSSEGAKEAVNYLQQCAKIAQSLVDRGIAEKAEYVDQVMTLGFHHIVGPLFPHCSK